MLQNISMMVTLFFDIFLLSLYREGQICQMGTWTAKAIRCSSVMKLSADSVDEDAYMANSFIEIPF